MLPPLQLLLQPFAVKPLTRFSHRLWFRTCSRRHSESRDHCQTVAAVILAPIVFSQVPLRSSSADLPFCGNLTTIGAPTRRQNILRKNSRAPHAPTCRQAPSRTITRLHALHAPSLLLLTSALGDVITATSSADVTRQLVDIIVDQDVDLR